MKIILEKWEEKEVADIAKSDGVDKDKLWDMYQDIMERNFFDDLCDISRENEEELKGE